MAKKTITTTRDVEQNKGMAIIAYILFFIPILTGDHKKSRFVMYHTNQGLVLFYSALAGRSYRQYSYLFLLGFF